MIGPSADRPVSPVDRDSLADAKGRSSHSLAEACAVLAGAQVSVNQMASGTSSWAAVGIGARTTAALGVALRVPTGLARAAALLRAKVGRFMRS